jgi:hypothetical protein|tara:strand:- start:1408 stop:1701 length:294 start_codon:yes stop_codon:yes gene_type:complete
MCYYERVAIMLQHTETYTQEKYMVSNKNAYEIRTEILGMAQGFVMDKFHNKHQKWLDSTDKHPETGAILYVGDSPKYPTSDDILREAEKLYSFVDTK